MKKILIPVLAFALLVLIFVITVALKTGDVRRVKVEGFEDLEAELVEKYPPGEFYTEEELEAMEREYMELMELKIKKLREQRSTSDEDPN
jgi:hypothetical protein